MRTVVWICVPLGVLGIVLGVYGDAHGWWEHRSFLTNLTSSLTSVMFGIPTVLLLLGYLASAQAEALQRQQIRRRARRELESFLGVLLDPFNALTRQGLGDDLKRLRQAAEAVDACLEPRTMPRGTVSLEEWRSWFERVFALEGAYQQLLRDVVSSANWARELNSMRWHQWANDLRTHWNVLDQDVRPQVMECDEQWLSPVDSARVRDALAQLEPAVFLGYQDRGPDVTGRAVDLIADGTPVHLALRRTLGLGHRGRRAWFRQMAELLDGVEELAQVYG
ncbi:hypothetical protein ACWGQ5_00350 [Streptomyces sp. NPDC055722]